MMMKSNTWFVLRTCTGIELPKRSILLSIIDLQSFKYNDYRFLMVYQDHLTKFVILRALTSKRASEVAMQILDMSCKNK